MEYVLGALALLVFQLLGIAALALWRRDLVTETASALTNMLTWPVGVVMQGIVWPIYRRRRERERQARITAKVQSGEYAVEHARNLGWKG